MSVQAASNLPFANEVMLNVLSYLAPKDLAGCAKTCKEWRKLAYDESLWNSIEKRLPVFFPSLSVINGTIWKNYVDLDAFGLDVEGEGDQTLSKRASLILILRAVKELTPLIEENAGVTLLTIPRGLTFTKLVALAESPKQGNSGRIVFWDRFQQEFGEIPVDETYRIVISNSLLWSSSSPNDHLAQGLVTGHEGNIPRVLEVSTLSILTNMVFSTRLFGNSRTFTICRETIDVLKMSAGGFLEGMFSSYTYCPNNELYGVAIARKV